MTRYAWEIGALFGSDPCVDIVAEESPSGEVLRIGVCSRDKCEAIRRILPYRHDPASPGKSTTVDVYYNGCMLARGPVAASDFEKAFEGNPAFAGLTRREGNGGSYTYAEFSDRPAQYYGDDSSDPDGVVSMLLSDAARDVFADVPHPGVRFTTAVDSCVRTGDCLDDDALFSRVRLSADPG